MALLKKLVKHQKLEKNHQLLKKNPVRREYLFASVLSDVRNTSIRKNLTQPSVFRR